MLNGTGTDRKNLMNDLKLTKWKILAIELWIEIRESRWAKRVKGYEGK